jgi:hypothetical protein
MIVTFDEIPANYTVYTLYTVYIYGSGQPYFLLMGLTYCLALRLLCVNACWSCSTADRSS